jgi:hypothetical protein
MTTKKKPPAKASRVRVRDVAPRAGRVAKVKGGSVTPGVRPAPISSAASQYQTPTLNAKGADVSITTIVLATERIDPV